jgi:hypothetical protein
VTEAAERIGGLAPVREVEVNSKTGSIYIRFDPENPVADMLEEVRGLGYAVEDAFSSHHLLPPMPPSLGARQVQQALRQANARVHIATDGLVDLRLVVPGAVAVLALTRMISDFQSIRKAPWYQLLYYALDSFYKLHAVVEPAVQAAPPRRRR